MRTANIKLATLAIFVTSFTEAERVLPEQLWR